MSFINAILFNKILGVDFLAGEFFLDIGGMILRVTKDDEVRERHFDGVNVTGTNVLTQKYYSPFSESEIDYKPTSAKEILCYLEVSLSGSIGDSNSFNVLANTTKDSTSGARDILGKTFTSTVPNVVIVPPFILRENEFLNIEGQKISTSRNWAVWLHAHRSSRVSFRASAPPKRSTRSRFGS